MLLVNDVLTSFAGELQSPVRSKGLPYFLSLSYVIILCVEAVVSAISSAFCRVPVLYYALSVCYVRQCSRLSFVSLC